MAPRSRRSPERGRDDIMTDHDTAAPAVKLSDDDIAELVRDALDYFAQTPSALAAHRDLQRAIEDVERRRDSAQGAERERPLRRRVSHNSELQTRVVLSMFRHRGMP